MKSPLCVYWSGERRRSGAISGDFCLLAVLVMSVLLVSMAAGGAGAVTISGYVRSTSGLPIEDALVVTSDYAVDSCYTNANGYYAVIVSWGWSGKILVERDGFVRDSVGRTYKNVTTNLTQQNFTLTPYPTVSGHIRTPEGYAVQGIGVTTYSDEYGTGYESFTDAEGYYCLSVVPGQTGRVEAAAYDQPFSLEPSSRPYTNLRQNLKDQDFTAIQYLVLCVCLLDNMN